MTKQDEQKTTCIWFYQDSSHATLTLFLDFETKTKGWIMVMNVTLQTISLHRKKI
jgi:hypothetical protein